MQHGLRGQKVLVVGAGWLGQPAAQTLAALGATVWTLRRSPSADSVDGVTALAGDIRTPDVGASWVNALPTPLDAVIVCIAPSQRSGDDHQATYPASVRGALAFATQHGCRSLIYTSSTGVYGRTDGGISREDDTIERRDARQQALLDAELALREPAIATGVDRTILRVAGLYGPGRNPANRFRADLPTSDDDVWCNFSWRDDVIGAIAHLLTLPAVPGRVRVLNCADGVPLRASAIARALGATAPAATGTGRAQSPSGRSNQQILVDPLRALGWTPTMTTVFDGLVALGEAPTLPFQGAPYGPATADVRRFLVQLAGLGALTRASVVTRYVAACDSPAFIAAEALLGETIERAGRTDARDALGGPLLQLVQRPSSHAAEGDVDVDALDPIAEPALAALLALMVRDLLPTETAACLYAPFADTIPWPTALTATSPST